MNRKFWQCVCYSCGFLGGSIGRGVEAWRRIKVCLPFPSGAAYVANSGSSGDLETVETRRPMEAKVRLGIP